MNFTREQLVEATKMYGSMGRKRGDTESYLKLILRWEPTVVTATLDEIERQLNRAPQAAVAVAEPEPVAPQPAQFVDPAPKFPQALKDRPNWVLWKLALVNGKMTKVPYQSDFKTPAATTRPNEWSDYKTVAQKIQIAGGITEKQGIGRVVQKEERVVGIDLDGCRDAQTGTIAQWAEDLVDAVNSYCEITPSQTGLRI